LPTQATYAQKFWPSSTTHRPFEGFEAVDLSFRLAVVGSHLGLRISNFVPKKPSNVRISSNNILTFDVEILVGVTFIGAIVALGVAYYFLR
jgi:hypothetical protein